ncbi:alpha/beta hydrolase [Paenibacillus sp. 1001270B_150601_E10]|uniref:alpha/beta hydrolase n=1 Tax=Paenibacillus sp. 1001270B_150601_E10 TaxID=2787079 RepID=UPI00189EABD8|nr:alpha/beta hydrolase family protein [Paenibacillus sp. 1001270B_150601_E10]
MALITCNFYSEALGINTEITAIIPQATSTQYGLEGKAGSDRHPTLFLLHGLSDDHTIWLRRTSIERYAAALGLAVIMPNVHRSFYTDMEYGLNYWTFLSKELPRIVRSFFPLSDKREDNFVAGLSMGGYGAFKWALTCPDQFAAAASLSGALNIKNEEIMARNPRDMKLIFGEGSLAGSKHDLLHLLDEVDSKTGPKPMLYQCCGTEDFLYQDNLVFRDHAERSSLSLTYQEGPGSHSWDYWDARIQDVLAWLPLQNRK